MNLLQHPALYLRDHIRRHREFRTNRDLFKTLLKLDNKILDDMGITRDEVIWASELPPSRNAAVELKIVSYKRQCAERNFVWRFY